MNGSLRRTWRVWRYFASQYRRTWKGSLVETFLAPLLYLAALGVGLGSEVHGGRPVASLGGVRYLTFLGTGLLAPAVVQVAASETTYPVVSAIKWQRVYDAMLATPVGVGEVVAGQLAWVATRLGLAAAAFGIVLVGFGLTSPLRALFALPVAVVTGLAVGAPVAAYSVTRETDAGLAGVFRFVVVPLLLFSGTFFPVGELPFPLQVVVRALPLAPGVAASRAILLGRAAVGPLAAEIGQLLAVAAAGTLAARLAYRHRLRR